MHLYVASKGQRLGPMTFYRVSELLGDGELSPDDLGWHQGRDEWTPLREIPALMSVIEAKRERDFLRESTKPLDRRDRPANRPADGTGAAGASSSAGQPTVAPGGSPPVAVPVSPAVAARPFSRFWARMFDYVLVSLVVYALFGPLPMVPPAGSVGELFSPEYLDGVRAVMMTPEGVRLSRAQSAALVLWTLLEGFLLARYGTTPGKALLGIRVVGPTGGRMPVRIGMMRALFVWLAGVGMWLPLIPLFTLGYGLYCLLSRGVTLWDAHLQTRVRHAPLTPTRILLAIGAFLGIVLAHLTIALR